MDAAVAEQSGHAAATDGDSPIAEQRRETDAHRIESGEAAAGLTFISAAQATSGGTNNFASAHRFAPSPRRRVTVLSLLPRTRCAASVVPPWRTSLSSMT